MAEFLFNGPLDRALVKAFNRALDTAFDLSRLLTQNYDLGDEYASAVALVDKLGMRILNDSGLLRVVLDCLTAGPAEGDIEGALSVLWDMGILDLSDDVLNQIHAVKVTSV